MIELIPMTEQEFQTFQNQSIQDYAQDHVQAGRWSQQEALQQATQEFQELLPQGLHSPDQYLYMIVDNPSEQRVGLLWFAVRTQATQKMVFVYDVVIFEAFRRHGYATQAFQTLEDHARELGATSIGLHVFGHNHAARDLYEKLGYMPTNIQMVKQLS
jgi:RimJ/RimL family protein N-acetyltransferase